MIIDHPSVMTTKSSFNGKAIVKGESIIIPIASKILEVQLTEFKEQIEALKK